MADAGYYNSELRSSTNSDDATQDCIMISVTGEIERTIDEIYAEIKERQLTQLVQRWKINGHGKRLPPFGPFNAVYKVKRNKKSARRLRY
jgi:hypothetical protein